jgi:hypothetical protein
MSITIMLHRLWEGVVREFLKFQKHHFKNLKIAQDLFCGQKDLDIFIVVMSMMLRTSEL